MNPFLAYLRDHPPTVDQWQLFLDHLEAAEGPAVRILRNQRGDDLSASPFPALHDHALVVLLRGVQETGGPPWHYVSPSLDASLPCLLLNQIFRHDPSLSPDLPLRTLYKKAVALQDMRESSFGPRCPLSPADVLVRWTDGATLQKLSTPQEFNAEGLSMQHCLRGVLHYYAEARRGDIQIWSYRNPQGIPQATIEVVYTSPTPFVRQLQGPGNGPIYDPLAQARLAWVLREKLHLTVSPAEASAAAPWPTTYSGPLLAPAWSARLLAAPIQDPIHDLHRRLQLVDNELQHLDLPPLHQPLALERTQQQWMETRVFPRLHALIHTHPSLAITVEHCTAGLLLRHAPSRVTWLLQLLPEEAPRTWSLRVLLPVSRTASVPECGSLDQLISGFLLPSSLGKTPPSTPTLEDLVRQGAERLSWITPKSLVERTDPYPDHSSAPAAASSASDAPTPPSPTARGA